MTNKLKSTNHFGEEVIKVPRFSRETGFITSENHSHKMKRVPQKNTKCEVKFRKAIWALGYRYRVNFKGIKGTPDVLFSKKRVAVFIDGNYWHGYDWTARKAKVTTNKDYWIAKIERNMQRDREINHILSNEGWLVVRFWDHDVNRDINECIKILLKALSTR